MSLKWATATLVIMIGGLYLAFVVVTSDTLTLLGWLTWRKG